MKRDGKSNPYFSLFLVTISIGAAASLVYDGMVPPPQWEEQVLSNDEIYQRSFQYKDCSVSLRRDGKGISAIAFYSKDGIIAKQSLEIIKDGGKTVLTSEATRTAPKGQKGNSFSQPFQTECLGPAKSLPEHVRTFIFDIYN